MQVTETAQALFYTAPGVAELREVALAPLAPGQVEVRTLWSSISRGTERLVSAGAVPPGEYAAMRAPHQEGDFPFPVKYGYAAVGVAVAGPDALVGRHVFSLYPHQTRFRLPADAVTPLPDDVPAALGEQTIALEDARPRLLHTGKAVARQTTQGLHSE